MNCASLNFTLDVILILVSLGFLVREYPVRTFFVTVLCIGSYLLPISLLEHALNAPTSVPEATATTNPARTDDNSDDTTSQIRQQVQQFSQADPTQTTRNVTGIWNLVLNGLNNVPGSSSSGTPIDINQVMAERAGKPLPGNSTANSGATIAGQSMAQHFNAVEQALLSGRFGYSTLRPKEVLMVDQFWFLARCCLLLGAAYFLFFDWKITLSIVSLGVIPIHYYMVLFYFLSTNWQKTRPWWGTFQAIGIALLVLVLLAIIGRQILLHTDKHSFHIPDPGQYRARMGGLEYDYAIVGNSLQLAGISLDLANSYLDEKNRDILRFTSGAAIEFIPRAEN